MGYRRVEPHNERAKIEFARMERRFPYAVDAVREYGRISLQEVGLDWNRCVFEKLRRGGIVFSLGGENGSWNRTLDGVVRNIGHDHRGLDVKKGMTGVDFSDNYFVNSVSEGVQVCSRLEIVTDELLPSGTVNPSDGEGGHRGYPDTDDEQYRIFAAELLERAKTIIVSMPNGAFGTYIVVETHPGYFIAYNKKYGEGPYIVDDFETLFLDKQKIRKGGLAIRLRRDRRGDWEERIREFL